MSNPDGNTGYREVEYVKPGLTRVYYNDRVLDIKTHGESNEDFASKVKARTGKVPKGYKTREQAYAERRAAAKKRTQKALAEKKRKAAAKAKTTKAKTTAGTKARTKTTAPTIPAPRTASAPRTAKKTGSRSAAPKTNFEKLLASGKYVIE